MAGRPRPLSTARITTTLIAFLASPRRREDPFPAYRRLQTLDRVHHSPIGVWVLSGHAEVAAVLRDPRFSSDERHLDLGLLRLGPLRLLLGRGSASTEKGVFFDRVSQLMLFRDPPDHTRLRKLVSRSFTARRVADLETRMVAIANELLDGVATGGEAEFMSRFAYPFPARVICELIGVPQDELHHIVDHAPALAGGLDPGPVLSREARDEANDAAVAIVDYLRDLIDRRRSNPGDDLISALLTASDADDDLLTGEEVIDMTLLLLIAGHETTANLLGNGLVALLDDPGAFAELRARPDLVEAAVDELLRFDSPVQLTVRFATEPVEVAGATIPVGAVVICCTGAANRDESVFTSPDRLDWHREENPHLAFGGGIHHCIGAPLAKAEARIALEAILRRLEHLRITERPVRRPSFTIRGLSELDLTWSASEADLPACDARQ